MGRLDVHLISREVRRAVYRESRENCSVVVLMIDETVGVYHTLKIIILMHRLDIS